jgi:transforming growth factor-beta-induced protein
VYNQNKNTMKTIHKKLQALLAMLLVVTFSFMLTSCDEDDDENMIPDVQQENIIEIAAADQGFSLLVQALTKANLVSTLQGEGPFTVFAPNNAAFEQLLADLGISSLDDLTAEQLTPILLYHVVSGKVMSSDLTDGYVSTLSPGPNDSKVSVLVDAGNVVLNASSDVIQADVEAENGVIHVIDEVLLPPTVVDIAVDNGNFTSLVAALIKADLVSTLEGDGPFTVFAPTDAAFADLLSDLGASSLDDIPTEDLIPILQQHVISGNVRSTDLSSGDVQTLNGTISVEVGDQVTINGNASVTAVDIQGKNGVVHVIDKVILPPQNIVDIASGDENFESLVAALTKAELVETLQGEGPFTVFAPTDAAFEQLLADLGLSGLDELTKEDLTPILLYHVLSGKVMSSDLTDGYVSSLSPGAEAGTNAAILIDAALAQLNGDITISTTDIEASNGVIHVIDKVMLPNDVVDLAINNSIFSSLVAALTKAELVETLQGEGPFTVFAPTDAAFTAFLDDQGVTLDDLTKEDLVPILQYHVVSGNVTSDELSNGPVTTLNGDVTISIDGGGMVNDANVILADVQGTNGVVHAIDKVLVPSTK